MPRHDVRLACRERELLKKNSQYGNKLANTKHGKNACF